MRLSFAMRDFFSEAPPGPLAGALGPGYRSRPEQLRMAEAVERAIGNEQGLNGGNMYLICTTWGGVTPWLGRHTGETDTARPRHCSHQARTPPCGQ
jgi:hypothetical protein